MGSYQRMGFRFPPLMEHTELGTTMTAVQFHDTYLELNGDYDRCRVAETVEHVRPRLEAGDGFFMSSFTSANLEADRPIIEATGIELAPIVSARRRVRLPGGGWGETDSRSMYAWNGARPLMSSFLSDHRVPEMIWIREYQIHPNTAEKVETLTYMAALPQADEDSFAKMLGYGANISNVDQVAFQTPRGEVLEILSPTRCREKYGRLAPQWIPSLGGYGVGLALAVSDLDRCRWALRDGGVPFREGPGDCIGVAQAHACGVVLEFRQC
jgi:glyoxalase-like protein